MQEIAENMSQTINAITTKKRSVRVRRSMRVTAEHPKSGYFWLPGQEESKIAGTLTICNGGDIKLEIIDHFGGFAKALDNNLYLGRIVGFVEETGLVTLEDCHYATKNISFGKISKSIISARWALTGVEYEKDESITFNSLSFATDCLDEWIGISGIEVDHEITEGSPTIRETVITARLPGTITHNLDNGMRLEFVFRNKVPSFGSVTEVKVTQKSYLKLISDESRPLTDFTALAHKLTTLICFAVGTTVSINDVIAQSFELLGERNGKKHYHEPVGVFYSSVPFTKETPKKIVWQEMLFSYRTVRPNAGDVFNKWLQAYNEMEPAMNLYFTTKSGIHRYVDSQFLALIQGLETYHRRTSSETKMDEDEFQCLISSILDKCPDDYKTWLEGRLIHGNEINLRQRLTRIIEPFKEMIGNRKVRKSLITKIVDTRNYLTHYSENLKATSANGAELWILSQKLEVIFQLHFLKVIGFTSKEIADVVNNNYPIRKKLTANYRDMVIEGKLSSPS